MNRIETPRGTNILKIQVPHGGFQIEKAQFEALSNTPSETTNLEIFIEDGRITLDGYFDVHDKFRVNSNVFRSNRKYKNRVYTLEKRENKKDKTTTYWFVPVNPGKENTEYPAFLYNEVILPRLPKTSRLMVGVKHGVRKTLHSLTAAAVILTTSLSVKKALDGDNLGSNEARSSLVENTVKEGVSRGPMMNKVLTLLANLTTGNSERIETPPAELISGDSEKESEKEKPEKKENIYIVKKGDTMSKIAKKFGLETVNLLRINKLKKDSIIEIGQEIELGTPATTGEKKLAQGLTKYEHITLINNACNLLKVTDKGQTAYIIATAEHESDKYRAPGLQEYANGSAYERRSDLGNTKPGDGRKYKGRGYVQLTGRRNYEKYNEILHKAGLLEKDQNIVTNPELVSNPEIAAFILVHGMKFGNFTGEKLSTYVREGKQDFLGARNTVNGSDRNREIANLAREILKSM